MSLEGDAIDRARSAIPGGLETYEDILDWLQNSDFGQAPDDILEGIAEDEAVEPIAESEPTTTTQIGFDRIPTGPQGDTELTPQADRYQAARDERFTQMGNAMVWRGADGAIIGSRENVVIFERPDGAIVGRNINTGTERVITEP